MPHLLPTEEQHLFLERNPIPFCNSQTQKMHPLQSTLDASINTFYSDQMALTMMS